MTALKRIGNSVLGNKPRLIIFIALVLAVGLVMSRPERAPVEIPEKVWPVNVQVAAPSSRAPTVELYGTVLSPQDAELSAAIEADVLEILALEGSSVQAGDLLARLDSRDAELELAEREAGLMEASATLELARRKLDKSRRALAREQELLAITASKSSRAEELFAEDLLSQADVETTQENYKRQQLALNQSELAVEETRISILQLQAQLDKATAQRDRAALRVERSLIRAPFDGVVSELTASVGDRLRPGDKIMRLQNPASLEIRAQIPSRFAEDVAEALNDAAVAARIDLEGKLFAGELVRLAGQTRAGSGGVDSFVRLQNKDIGLRLGATVRVLIDLPAVDGTVSVPAEALYGQNRIYRAVDSRLEMLTVEKVGERLNGDGSAEVLVKSEKLTDGDLIVVTKLANATDGLLVEPLLESNTQSAAAPTAPRVSLNTTARQGG